MEWLLPSLRRGFMSWLLRQPAEQGTPARVVEEIRRMMLELLDSPECARFDQLLRRIRFAQSATELWYLRADVLTVLSGELGESGAGAALAPVTAMFDRIVPPAMRSRQSPLAG